VRALWKGYLTFGLVTIPVRVFVSAQRRTLHFNQIHKECGSPINYRKWCPVCETDVREENIQMGYEFQKNQYVLFTDEELEAARPEKSGSIEILEFINAQEMDHVYFEKMYYLEPSEGGWRAYGLLSWALKEREKIAIAKMTLRTRQSLAVIRHYQEGALAMHTMFYPDEIRPFSELEGVQMAARALKESNPKETEMAVALVERLTVKFEPSRYRDDTRERLGELIETKLRGEQVTVPRPKEPARITDLMEALRASVEMADRKRAESKDAGEAPISTGEPSGRYVQ
jgi:DNA end-binding protein Ku